MGVPVIDTGPMTVEEFYAFTDRRPDDEKWELIEGEPILHAAPSRYHQQIVANLIFVLRDLERGHSASWTVIPGIGVRLSSTSRPQPDVMVVPTRSSREDLSARDCVDPIVLFEIISPSTADRDLRWKRAVYTGMPSLSHYVVVAQDAIEVVVFSRETGFAEQRLKSPSALLSLSSLGVSFPLSDVYRNTGLT